MRIYMLRKLARPFVVLVDRYYPDPFIFTTLLTMVTFIMAFVWTDTTLMGAIRDWGGGFKMLMTFIGQISFTLIASHAMAHTTPVQNILGRMARLPRTRWQAYAMTIFIAGLASLISWAFGLVAGALIAREVAATGRKRGMKLHYPLLVALAYSGFMLWHMGYTGSAQLFVATEGHAFQDLIGGVIPVSETLFAGYNILTALFLLFTMPLLLPLMAPAEEEDVYELQSEMVEEMADGGTAVTTPEPGEETFGQKLDRQRWINLVIGLGLVIYLGDYFVTQGVDLNLNIVNWSFLTIGLLLANSPVHYVKLVGNASVRSMRVLWAS